MSWGYKILIVYVAFVVMMLGMVFVCSMQTNEMQEENYYAKELKYQDVIDGKNNLNAIAQKASLTNTGNDVLLKIPLITAVNIKDGKIYFLRPSDQTKDFRLALQTDEKGEQQIALSSLVSGLYSVQISWKSNNKIYYFEQNFSVQK